MFASKTAGGFYDPEFHGARLVTIQDPAWVRPTRAIVILPGESVWIGDEQMANTGDEPITFHNVPDMDVMPATLEVVNPDCLIPTDAVEITAAEHVELLEGQAEGKVIAWGDDGYPVLIDPPPLTPEEAAAFERAWRDARLAATDGVVSRHRDELEGSSTTLTATQYTEFQVYRRQLRDWPQGEEFPLADRRPVAPSWFTETSSANL